MNIGSADDYRVPGRAYLRGRPRETFVGSVAIVVEIVSPNDETWDKLDFYLTHGVEEMLIVDARPQNVQWLTRGPDGMTRVDRSRLLGLSAQDLHRQIDWPPTD